MGYDTRFTGSLEFTTEMTAPMLAKLSSMFGEDCRDHPEWSPGPYLYYVDLVLLPDFSGVEFDADTEKTTLGPEMVNMITGVMMEEYPEFSFKGQMIAQGEDPDDRWRLVVDDTGIARRVDWPRIGQRVTCPCCECEFTLEDDT